MACDLHEATTDRGVECADQVGEKHKCIIEYPNHGQLTNRTCLVNFLGELTYSSLDIFL